MSEQTEPDKLRDFCERGYDRKLTDEELEEIRLNLAGFVSCLLELAEKYGANDDPGMTSGKSEDDRLAG
ncbi:hypothetical protein HYS54_04175 [Candidatus Micrarchaeota archaeon]|nr:hypothetical protein [Candidatus Micrarchaeota archaeon]